MIVMRVGIVRKTDFCIYLLWKVKTIVARAIPMANNHMSKRGHLDLLSGVLLHVSSYSVVPSPEHAGIPSLPAEIITYY